MRIEGLPEEMSNSQRRSQDDQVCPIEQLLREEFLVEQERVDDSRDFAASLRDRIESEAVRRSENAVSERFVAGTRSRRPWRVAIVGLATALTLFVLVRVVEFGPFGNASVEHELVDKADSQVEVDRSVPSQLNEDDAVAAMKLVNFGLGQSVQTVGGFRTSLAKFLEPLRAREVRNGAVEPESRLGQSIDVTDEQLVAKITWRVLGLQP